MPPDADGAELNELQPREPAPVLNTGPVQGAHLNPRFLTQAEPSPDSLSQISPRVKEDQEKHLSDFGSNPSPEGPEPAGPVQINEKQTETRSELRQWYWVLPGFPGQNFGSCPDQMSLQGSRGQISQLGAVRAC